MACQSVAVAVYMMRMRYMMYMRYMRGLSFLGISRVWLKIFDFRE